MKKLGTRFAVIAALLVAVFVFTGVAASPSAHAATKATSSSRIAHTVSRPLDQTQVAIQYFDNDADAALVGWYLDANDTSNFYASQGYSCSVAGAPDVSLGLYFYNGGVYIYQAFGYLNCTN